MSDLPKPAALRRFQLLMQVMGVMYALAAAVVFFFPSEVFYLINVGPKVFKTFEAIPDAIEHFWMVYASAMLGMLSALSLLAAESPYIRGYTLVHLLAKVIATVGFAYQFLNHERYFAYLLGAVLEFPGALLISWALVRLPRPISLPPQGAPGGDSADSTSE